VRVRGVLRDLKQSKGMGDFGATFGRQFALCGGQIAGAYSQALLALRRIVRRPALPLLVSGSLGVGLAANFSVYSVAREFVRTGVPDGQSGELAMIWRGPKGRPSTRVGFDPPLALSRQISTVGMFRTWRQAQSFHALAAVESSENSQAVAVDLSLGRIPFRLRGAAVTPNFFDLLGIRSVYGRTFAPADQHVALLSDGVWRRLFGHDPAIIGKSIRMTYGRPRTPRPVTIVGILPESFQFAEPENIEVWLPLPWSEFESAPNNALRFNIVAALKPGVSIRTAEAEVAALYDATEVELGVPDHLRMTARLESLSDYSNGRSRSAVRILGALTAVGLFGCMLTATCSMLLAGLARRREFSVQMALGAANRHILLQVTAEWAYLTILTCAIAAFLTAALRNVLMMTVPTTIIASPETTDTWRTLALMAGAVCGSTAAVSLVALAFSWRRKSSPLIPNSQTPSRDSVHLRSVLVAAQVVLAVWSLTLTSSLLRELWTLNRTPLGFDSSGIVVAQLRILTPTDRSATGIRQFGGELLERVKSMPGVRSASLASAPPFSGIDWVRRLQSPVTGQQALAHERQIANDYFAMLGIPLHAGRLPRPRSDPGDITEAAVSIALGEFLYPGVSPIGRPLPNTPPGIIVGVVGDVRGRDLRAAPNHAFYISWLDTPGESVCLLIDSASELRTWQAMLPGLISSLDPDLPVLSIDRLDRLIAGTIADERFFAWTTTAFGSLALLLMGVGLWCSMKIETALRGRELQIRSGLGATRRDLTILLVTKWTRFGIAGIAAGTAAGFWSVQFVRSTLIPVEATGFAHFAVPALTVAVVAGIIGAAASQRAAASTFTSGHLES